MQVKALPCESPAARGVPLSRLRTADIAAEARGLVATVSNTTVWCWLHEDAIPPWHIGAGMEAFRPRQPIAWAPQRVGYDENFVVGTPDAVYADADSEVLHPRWLVSVRADPMQFSNALQYSNNTDGRYVEVAIVGRAESSLTVHRRRTGQWPHSGTTWSS